MLAGLAVVFVGIGGDDAARIDRQVGALLHRDTGAEVVKVSPADRRALARHTRGAGAIARRLHADGVVAGELVTTRGAVVLRIAAYDHAGGLVGLLELPLASRQLGKGELAMLRTQLVPDLEALLEAGASDTPAAAPRPGRATPAPIPTTPTMSPRPLTRRRATSTPSRPATRRMTAAMTPRWPRTPTRRSRPSTCARR